MFGQVSGILMNISLGEMYSREGTGDGLLLVFEEKDCIGESLELIEDLDVALVFGKAAVGMLRDGETSGLRIDAAVVGDEGGV